jgi:hypothetical protein
MARLVIEITYMFGDFGESFQKDASAVKVLDAFKLREALLDKEFWFRAATALSVETQTQELHARAIQGWQGVMVGIVVPYTNMVSCVKPFTVLTIPADLLNERREEVLAVNLSDRESLDLKILAKVLGEMEALYDAINRAFARADAPPLQIIKIESGSSLRIDLKGLAETIKELKNAVLEIWTKHRHKKADEIIDQHRVVSSGIEVLTQIDLRVRKKELAGEDGARFKRAIVLGTLGLFKNGALIDEIPPIEVVDNVRLLDGFAYKLLAAPREDLAEDGMMTGPGALGGTLQQLGPHPYVPPALAPSKRAPAQRKLKTRKLLKSAPTHSTPKGSEF